MNEKMVEAVGYIAYKLGGANSFRISRILVLANWKSEERLGRPLYRFRVFGFEAGFGIEGMKKILEHECLEKSEEKKIYWRCEPPDPEGKEILDEVIEETRGLSDMELNRLVIRDTRYEDLLKRGGF